MVLLKRNIKLHKYYKKTTVAPSRRGTTLRVILNHKCPRKRTSNISLTSQNKTTAKRGAREPGAPGQRFVPDGEK